VPFAIGAYEFEEKFVDDEIESVLVIKKEIIIILINWRYFEGKQLCSNRRLISI